MNNGVDDVNGDCEDGIQIQGKWRYVTQVVLKRSFGDRDVKEDQPIEI